jgi:hypothetical protein
MFAHSGEWIVVARGGGPIPTRPLSPSAARRLLERLDLGAAGMARDVVRRVKRRMMEVRNFIFGVVTRLKVIERMGSQEEMLEN